jgi:polyhydroxyalkanoate synthesis regulator protein
VLTQIIVDEEARGSTMLPVNFLRQLIGLYGNSMQGMVPEYLEAAMDAFQRNQSVMRDAFGGNVLADIAKKNMAILGEASRAFTPQAKAKADAKAKAAADKTVRDAEVEKLRAELAALQAKVDRLDR